MLYPNTGYPILGYGAATQMITHIEFVDEVRSVKRPALRFKSPEVIKEYRRKQGMNQSEFWSRVGVTQSGGSRYESGRSIPRPVQLLLQLAYGTDAQAGAMLEWLRARDS